MSLKLFFAFVQLLNLFTTIMFYTYADIIDPSKVQQDAFSNNVPAAFSRVPSNRTSAEDNLFAFCLLIQIVSVVAILCERPLLISAYCLATISVFFFGIMSTPYFIYFFRYCLDIIALFVAFTLRSRLIVNFSVLRLRRS